MDVDEKALGLIDGWEAGHYHGPAQKKAALQVAIIKALREQDQDTRHACAEAVSAVPTTTCLEDIITEEIMACRCCLNCQVHFTVDDAPQLGVCPNCGSTDLEEMGDFEKLSFQKARGGVLARPATARSGGILSVSFPKTSRSAAQGVPTDIDEKALRLIEEWEAGRYYGPAQRKAALQVAIADALREQSLAGTGHKKRSGS